MAISQIEQLSYWKKIEVDSRKPIGDALHPDDAEKIVIKGVVWAVPSRGIQFKPEISGDSITMNTSIDEWPEADALVELITNGMTGSKDIEDGMSIELETGSEMLQKALILLVKMFRKQYTMTDEQLSELLTFETVSLPQWFNNVVQLAMGMPIKEELFFLDMMETRMQEQLIEQVNEALD